MLVALGSDAPGPVPWPKIARLHALARAGLPVPAGVFAARDELGDETSARRIFAEDPRLSRWLHEGPLIVRSAALDEDDGARSAAGLGSSVAHCTDVDALASALAQIDASADDPWLAHYRRGAGHKRQRDAPRVRVGVLIQRQVDAHALCVVAVPPQDDARSYLEVHCADDDHDVFEALARGQSPAFAGPLSAWSADAAPAVTGVVQRARKIARDPAPHGLDLEIAVDGRGVAWLVQLRPLTASPWPGWDEFGAALEAEREAGRLPDLHGLLILDAEHNPAPLSAAHAGLIRWLGERHPDTGGLAVVADWLYVRTKVRDLGDAAPSASPAPDPVAALRRLTDELLPDARARLEQVRAQLRQAPEQIDDAVRTALEAFERMIVTYVRELVPARRGYTGRVVERDRNAATVLRGKSEMLDVLPVSWDLASPSLADALPESSDDLPWPDGSHATGPEDPERAVAQLTEWDDHLFALGLAPLRACYLHLSAAAGVATQRVFGLEPTELSPFLAADAEDRSAWLSRADARRTRIEAHGRLRPPPRLWHGWPVPDAGGGPLRGSAVGEDHEGPLAIRAGLDDLLARPPEAGAIACLPALTAQAAVALDRLAVRAVCTEFGGAMSHGAIMARELGLSAIIGCRGCTDLPEGQRRRIDVTSGRLVMPEA